MSDTSAASADQLNKALGSTTDYQKSVGTAVANIESLSKRQADAMDKLLAKQEKAIDEGEKESQAAYKNIQPFKPLPPPDQRQYQTDPLQSFFSLGSVFGILASAFTHQPWTTSFEAAAAAIDARNRSDAVAYDHAFNAWKENTDLMFKRHQIQMDDWQAINENTKNDLTLRDALMRGYEAKYGDQISASYRAAGLYGQLETIMGKRQEVYAKMLADEPKAITGGLIHGYDTAIKAGDKALAQKYLDELISIGKAQHPTALVMSKQQQERVENIDTALDQLNDIEDKLKTATQEGVPTTGIGGFISRGKETVESFFGATSQTPASDFASALDALKLQLPKLLTGTSRSAADEREKVNTILRGMSPGDTPAKTMNSLEQVRKLLKEFKSNLSGNPSGEQTFREGDILEQDGVLYKVTNGVPVPITTSPSH